MTDPRRRDDWLVHQLPVGMTDDDFFVRFVRIFQTVADSVLDHVDNMPHLFDVNVAPEALVRTIGSWMGVDWIDPSLPDHLQRRIVREYSAGLLWRGTKAGLVRLLELICEGVVVVEDSGGVYTGEDVPATAPFVRMTVPKPTWATEADLLRIVRSELPASVTFELIVDGRMAFPLTVPTAASRGLPSQGAA
jgi:phage tail-like protein